MRIIILSTSEFGNGKGEVRLVSQRKAECFNHQGMSFNKVKSNFYHYWWVKYLKTNKKIEIMTYFQNNDNFGRKVEGMREGTLNYNLYSSGLIF